MRELAHLYFDYMLYGTFFIGIECALSSFYSGIGKTKIVFYFHILVHILNILISYVLIFGVDNLIPEMGLRGAALGTLLSKGIAVLLLFGHFVQHYWHSPYNGAAFHLQLPLLKEGVAKGLPRSLGHMIAMLKWNGLAYFMTQKGGDHLLALSYGTSLFFPFFNEGISQGTVTIASYLKGAKSFGSIFKLLRSSFVMMIMGLLVMALPLLLVPEIVLDFYMKDPLSAETRALLISCSKWIWLMYLCNGIYLVSLSFATAFKETWFYLKTMAWGTLFWSFLPVYYAIQMRGASADVFWILVSLQPLFPALILFGMLIRRYFYPLYRVSFDHVSDNLI